MSLEEVQDSLPSPNNQAKALDSERISQRGRKPVFTIESWIPVVEKWENRDRMHQSFTLEELLKEHFGTYPDGTSIVSVQTYYAWARRVHKYLARQKNNEN